MSSKKDLSFGKTTAKQSAVIRQGGNEKGGRRKGPPAPRMNQNKGHMSSRALIDSRSAEFILRPSPNGLEAQQWKSRHDGDVVQLVHPTAKNRDGSDSVRTLRAAQVLDYLDQGFKHVPTPEGEMAELDPAVSEALRTPILRGQQNVVDARGAEIAERNAEVVARKAAEAEAAAAKAAKSSKSKSDDEVNG